ncbi:hypothetical protein J5N97_000672 [Dioscorea zingiberensis]|uniref:Uncharacterized protein n=1 Tax=Dioscorea zingiberensis TaxID=325984 RepID=A0A9D5H1D0_9LILI|nr:hypothetical protein J5N97_000672 [Dioscorea zingiberensis]
MAEEKNKVVEIIETCMVVPDKETPKHRLWLSNLDLFNHKDHAPTFYLYKPNGNPNDFFSVETLKKALGKALVTFYPLAGRLSLDEDGRLEVDCNAEGALFSVASAHCTVEGFGDFRPSPAVRQLLVPSVTEAERSSILMLFQLNTLKHGFNGERDLSTFKAVAVHLWRTACKARGLADEQDTRLFVIADARAWLQPPLPAGYLGNAVVRVSANLQVGELVSKPFELGVAKIEETTNMVDDEYLRSFVDLLEKVKCDKKLLMDSRGIKRTDFYVVSWLTLPIYEADFGWGKPWFMGRASMRCIGHAYLKRTPGDSSGGVTVTLAFETGNMPRFKEIFYSDLDSHV